jgi:hypothetical protein
MRIIVYEFIGVSSVFWKSCQMWNKALAVLMLSLGDADVEWYMVLNWYLNFLSLNSFYTLASIWSHSKWKKCMEHLYKVYYL